MFSRTKIGCNVIQTVVKHIPKSLSFSWSYFTFIIDTGDLFCTMHSLWSISLYIFCVKMRPELCHKDWNTCPPRPPASLKFDRTIKHWKYFISSTVLFLLRCCLGQWAGPLDLYGKKDAPALHESPSYGWNLSLIHIWRCRRDVLCRSRWSPYH